MARTARAPASMAGKNVVSKLADMKIKEVPGTVWGHIRDNVSWESYHSTRARMSSFLKDYTAKYIDTGSPRPLFDVMGILFITSYVIAYPQARSGRAPFSFCVCCCVRTPATASVPGGRWGPRWRAASVGHQCATGLPAGSVLALLHRS